MAITNSATGPSLLPFLQPGVPGITLRFLHADRPAHEKTVAAVEHPGFLADIRQGQVVIDGTGVLAEVFFLVQPDNYPAAISSELRPIANPDVENSWQQAFVQLRSCQSSAMPPAWSSQIDENGRLVPFRPLFYCRHMRIYCHPLCPTCGRPLELCRDDRMLREAGLCGYTDSLQRYLYCADCRQASSQAPFYCNTLFPDAPAQVRGCDDLVQDFSRLLAQSDLADDLPCVSCKEAIDCFGPPTLVLERMQAIHFYPFFLLMQPAPTLNALDFTALLSGIAPDEIEQQLVRHRKNGRLDRFQKFRPTLEQGPGFLFACDERHFLEVFYLKLTFLRELLALVTGGSAGPANRMTMEGVWVHLAENSARLPYLWNFHLQVVDPMGPPEPYTDDSRLLRARLREFAGTAWFYVLLVNAGQPLEAVQDGIEKIMSGAAHDGSTAAEHFAAAGSIFEARHIFRQAPGFVPPPHWGALWHEALALGIDLLRAGINAEQSWSDDDFFGQLDDLRQRVHRTLFEASTAKTSATQATATANAPAEAPAEAVPANPPEVDPSNDPQIAALLADILQQWPQAQAQAPDLEQTRLIMTPPALQPNEDGDYEETVILSAQEFPDTIDALDKTVAMSPQFSADAIDAPDAPDAPDEMDALDQTVALSPPTSPAPGGGPAEPAAISPLSSPAAGDDGDQTMVVSPRQTPPSAAASGAHAPTASADKPPAEDDLEQTVIIQPQQANKRKPIP